MNAHRLLIAALLITASPALAQAAPDAPAAVPAASAKLPLARQVIDQIWPIGTYRRVMNGTMDAMMGSVMSSMYDMKVSDMAGRAADAEKLGDATMGEVAEAADPHFKERMRITMDVTMDHMIGLMDRVEPDVREALARAYANRFTAAQLTDLKRFFDTPTGRVYASESMMLMADPEIMKAMQSFAPEMMKQMPAMLEKVKAATAHLPPPPKQEGEDEDGVEGTSAT